MSKKRGERRDRKAGRAKRGREIEGGSERETDREAEKGKGDRKAERKKSLIYYDMDVFCWIMSTIKNYCTTTTTAD